MKKSEYKDLRTTVGSRREVAEMLGVHPVTMAKREVSGFPITREAELAMRFLALAAEAHSAVAHAPREN